MKSINLIATVFLLYSCAAVDNTRITNTSEISMIAAPYRQVFCLSQTNSAKLIKTEKEFQQFTKQMNSFHSPKGSPSFPHSFTAQNYNFNAYNFVMYSQIETSGSVWVSANQPIWVGETIEIHINTSSPQIRTADMACHSFIYRVSKEVNKIAFRSKHGVIELTN